MCASLSHKLSRGATINFVCGLERWKMHVMQLLYDYTTTPHHILLTLPTQVQTHSSAYAIQQARNTPCRGPGAYSVNVWGQRASARINNRQNNQPRKPYMQAKNLQRHLKKVHGENCTVDKFHCIVFAKPLHCRIPGTTACTFKLVFHYLLFHFAIIH